MRRLLPIFIGVVISAVAIAVLVRTFDIGAMLDVLAQTDIQWLLAAGGVIMIQLVLRTIRWRALLPPGPNGLPIPVARLLPVLLIGYLGNAVLPARLGEPIRAVLVDRRERVGLPEALGSVLLERIVDLATLAVIVLLAALIVGAPPWITRIATIAAAIGGLVVLLLATTGVTRLVAILARHPAVIRREFVSRAMAALERLANTVGGPARRRAIGLAAAISALAWLLEGSTFWLVARSLDIELTPTSAMLIAGVTVLGTAVPSAPGYLGTYDLAASFAAKALGVPEAEALAFAVLVHAVTLLPIALGGMLSLLALDLRLGSLVKEAAAPGVSAREKP